MPFARRLLPIPPTCGHLGVAGATTSGVCSSPVVSQSSSRWLMAAWATERQPTSAPTEDPQLEAHVGLRLGAVFGVRWSLRDRDVMPTFLEGGAVQLSSATQVPK